MRSIRSLALMRLLEQNRDKLPKHVALIPDGNRRWATATGRPINYGHDVGLLQRVPEIINHAFYLGIKEMSVWLFSTDNWKRQTEEVNYLMNLYERFLTSGQLNSVVGNHNVRIRHIGRRDRVPQAIITQLECLEKKTVENKLHKLNLCLDYGGKDEILRGVNNLLQAQYRPTSIDENDLDNYINPQKISNPDLVIRTSGEMRTSGFMIWGAACSEYYFEKEYMPKYTPEKFNYALLSFLKRSRRYGGN